MDELILEYKNSIKYIVDEDTLNKYCYLIDILDKLDQLRWPAEGVTPQKIIDALNNIDYFDICYTCLMIYYDFPFDEIEKRGKYLLDFIKTKSLNVNEKEHIIDFILLYMTNNSNEIIVSRRETLKLGVISYKIDDYFRDEGREIIKTLEMLVTAPVFNFIYNNIFACYYDEKPLLTVEKVSNYFDKMSSKNHININLPKNKDYKYIAMYMSNYLMLRDDILGKINEYANILAVIDSKNESIKKKVEGNISEITRIFNNGNTDKLITIDDVINLKQILVDEELINLALLKVIEHNNRYIELYKKNKIKEKIGITDILKNYGYSFEKIDSKIISSLNETVNFNTVFCNNISKLLESLNKYKIVLTYENLEILIAKCINNVQFIEINGLVSDLIIKGIVDNYYINTHLEILYNNDYLASFANNVGVLLDNNIPVKNVLNSNIDIARIDTNELVSNISILSMYKINYRDANNRNFELLANTSSFDIIDLFIEEDLSDIVRNHPGYIQVKYENVTKRIHINHLIGAKVRTQDKCSIDKSLLKEKNYFLSDKDLDNFLCDHTSGYVNEKINNYLNGVKRNKISSDIVENSVVKLLDEEFLNNDNYLFDGIIISRVKFLRNFETLKNLCGEFEIKELVFNCLVNNSYLSIDEIEYIKICINSIFEKDNIVLKKII